MCTTRTPGTSLRRVKFALASSSGGALLFASDMTVVLIARQDRERKREQYCSSTNFRDGVMRARSGIPEGLRLQNSARSSCLALAAIGLAQGHQGSLQRVVKRVIGISTQKQTEFRV